MCFGPLGQQCLLEGRSLRLTLWSRLNYLSIWMDYLKPVIPDVHVHVKVSYCQNILFIKYIYKCIPLPGNILEYVRFSSSQTLPLILFSNSQFDVFASTHSQETVNVVDVKQRRILLPLLAVSYNNTGTTTNTVGLMSVPVFGDYRITTSCYKFQLVFPAGGMFCPSRVEFSRPVLYCLNVIVCCSVHLSCVS